jgi:4-amino-4-deoxy-L-arabinose transferase-like glycosyltransferase
VTTFELHFTQKLFLVSVISVVLASCVYVLKREFGNRVALFFGLLVSLEPFYYALTRVFHLEGLMSTLMLASFLWFYHYLQEKRQFNLILSALFASLAFLTKTSSLYLIPFMALLAFLQHALKGEFSFKSFFKELFSVKWLKPFGIWLLLSYLGFYLFWPAMWTAPREALGTVYRGISTIGMERGHTQIYFGELIEDPGPFYYLVVLALRSSVPLFLGLLLSFFTVKWANRKERKFLLYALLFTVFYAVQITIPSKKLDRYLLPSILSLSLIVSFLFAFLYSRMKKAFGVLLIFLILGWGIFNFTKLEKDYFSYFNPLFGGLETGMRILEPKWIIGHHEIVEYLRTREISKEYENDSGEIMIAFPEKYYTQIWLFIKELGFRPVIKDLTPHAKQAYLFFYPIWSDDSNKEDRFPLEYEDTIYLRDVPVWNVYRRVLVP